MTPELLVFDVVQPIGMFATLSYGVLLAKACEEKGIEPYIIASSPYYQSPSVGSDWFSNFFGHKRLQLSDGDIAALRAGNRVLPVQSRAQINHFARGSISREISNDISKLSEAARLFDKYFFIREHVLDDIEQFFKLHFDSEDQLGIHFRGTDHISESEFVDYRRVTDAALEYFSQFRTIFVATDDEKFLSMVRTQLRNKNIITFRPDTPSFHQTIEADNYQKGFHALADCLLLSRCQALIKTSSALSAWSKVFGGDLEVVLVGKPFSNPWKHVEPWYNLSGLGFFPETLLYHWDADTMKENRVIKILAEPPAPRPVLSVSGRLTARFQITASPPSPPWWALPMNCQAVRTEVVRRLIAECKIARIVETGTYIGTTTEFFAQFGVPVVTVEVAPDLARRSSVRLGKWKNVEVRVDDSVRVLQELAREPIDRTVPTLFYLDAHWGDHLTLHDEAELAVTHFAKAVLVIDDFAVPDDPGYGFDDYGPDKQLTLEYLLQAKLPHLSLYFPSAPSHEETGARRGCVIATASTEMATLLDGIPLLRRWIV